jgi:type II secretion system protein I
MLTCFRNKKMNGVLGRDAKLCFSIISGPPGSQLNLGFILLEVLVAVAILGAALAVLLGSINENLTLTSNSRDLIIAETLAQAKLTEIEAQGFPQLSQAQGEFPEVAGFKWFTSVTPASIPGLNVEIRVVHLLVTWDEGKKKLETTLAMSNLQ